MRLQVCIRMPGLRGLYPSLAGLKLPHLRKLKFVLDFENHRGVWPVRVTDPNACQQVFVVHTRYHSVRFMIRSTHVVLQPSVQHHLNIF